MQVGQCSRVGLAIPTATKGQAEGQTQIMLPFHDISGVNMLGIFYCTS